VGRASAECLQRLLGLPPGNLPRQPCGAIFSIALQISEIKILSLATFILEYPQTLCKTAREIPVAIYHLGNRLHQTRGGKLFPREI